MTILEILADLSTQEDPLTAFGKYITNDAVDQNTLNTLYACLYAIQIKAARKAYKAGQRDILEDINSRYKETS